MPDSNDRHWQSSFDLAKEQKRKLYLLVCDDNFSFDPQPVPEPAEKCALQLAHREAVLTDQLLWHTVRTFDELQRQIENLKVPLDVVRTELRQQLIRHRMVTRVVAAVIVVVLGVAIYGVSRLGKKVDERGEDVSNKVAQSQQKTAEQIEATAEKTKEGNKDVIQDAVRELTNPVVLGERIRKEIHATAEEKIKAIPDEKGRGR